MGDNPVRRQSLNEDGNEEEMVELNQIGGEQNRAPRNSDSQSDSNLQAASTPLCGRVWDWMKRHKIITAIICFFAFFLLCVGLMWLTSLFGASWNVCAPDLFEPKSNFSIMHTIKDSPAEFWESDQHLHLYYCVDGQNYNRQLIQRYIEKAKDQKNEMSYETASIRFALAQAIVTNPDKNFEFMQNLFHEEYQHISCLEWNSPKTFDDGLRMNYLCKTAKNKTLGIRSTFGAYFERRVLMFALLLGELQWNMESLRGDTGNSEIAAAWLEFTALMKDRKYEKAAKMLVEAKNNSPMDQAVRIQMNRFMEIRGLMQKFKPGNGVTWAEYFYHEEYPDHQLGGN